MNTLVALVAGMLFGGGLLLSGMTNPAVVLGFLDITGSWNPALAFTMGGAIAVTAPAYYFVRRRQRTLLGEAATLSRTNPVDVPLVTGSISFGVGWGLSGICPGPALIIATGGSAQAVAFVLAMGAGMLLGPFIQRFGRQLAPGSAMASDQSS